MFVVFLCPLTPPPSASNHGFLPRREPQPSLYSTGSVSLSVSLFSYLFSYLTNASEFWFGDSSSKSWWRCCWRTGKTTCFEIGLLPASTTTTRKRSWTRFFFFLQFNWIDLLLPSFILSLNDAAFSLADSARFELPWRFRIIHQKRQTALGWF